MTVASDPESSWQVRLKGKTLKALHGDSIAYFGDHVELSTGGEDFTSTLGVGGVVGTNFAWPGSARQEGPDAPVDPRAREEKVGPSGSKSYRRKKRLIAGRIHGNALRHRFRSSRSPRRPQRESPSTTRSTPAPVRGEGRAARPRDRAPLPHSRLRGRPRPRRRRESPEGVTRRVLQGSPPTGSAARIGSRRRLSSRRACDAASESRPARAPGGTPTARGGARPSPRSPPRA